MRVSGMRASNGWRNLMLRLALTVAAMLLAIALLRVSVADVLHRGAKFHFNSGPRDPANLELAQARLVPANKLDPQSPVTLELLGDVAYRRASLAKDDLVIRVAQLEKAREFYMAAVASRPNMGERWADLIVVCSELIEVRQKLAASRRQAAQESVDDVRVLKQALEHATRLAPWRSYVLSAVEEAAKLHDELLGPHERQIVAAAQARMAEKKRKSE
jgi:hypothetical protein